MRSHIRTLFLVGASVFLVSVFILISATSSIQAQGAVTATPTETLIPANASNNGGAFITLVRNMTVPAGTVLADVHASSSFDVSFDTKTNLGVSCTNVVVYRETGLGDLVIHPFTCTGNMLALKGTGGNYSADYFVVSFSSLSAAQAAPLFVVRSNQAQSLPELGGGLSSSTSSSSATMAATTTP